MKVTFESVPGGRVHRVGILPVLLVEVENESRIESMKLVAISHAMARQKCL
jgi:hypothetical protein